MTKIMIMFFNNVPFAAVLLYGFCLFHYLDGTHILMQKQQCTVVLT